MANSSSSVKGLPTRIDRYPAKMIGHLAERLVTKYAWNAKHLLDPFCGSGAVIRAAITQGVPTTGVDINPFGVLLSGVKAEGFDKGRAVKILNEVLSQLDESHVLPIEWDMKSYWYTPATVRKLEAIRWAAKTNHLRKSKSGRAVLLSLALAARLCSRADQRSPKPFISKVAIAKRRGRHFDPGPIMRSLLVELADRYAGRPAVAGKALFRDLAACESIAGLERPCTHVITSPPYINAQDYFRNSKLELYLLEGLLPFRVSDISSRFIGSERGLSSSVLHGDLAKQRRELVPGLVRLEKSRRELAIIVHTYFERMQSALQVIDHALSEDGTLVVVCGDNLIGGRRIVTWRLLNRMIEERGFTLFDTFEDKIRNRALAPARSGHKGLIKQEVVSAFRRNCK